MAHGARTTGGRVGGGRARRRVDDGRRPRSARRPRPRPGHAGSRVAGRRGGGDSFPSRVGGHGEAPLRARGSRTPRPGAADAEGDGRTARRHPRAPHRGRVRCARHGLPRRRAAEHLAAARGLAHLVADPRGGHRRRTGRRPRRRGGGAPPRWSGIRALVRPHRDGLRDDIGRSTPVGDVVMAGRRTRSPVRRCDRRRADPVRADLPVRKRPRVPRRSRRTLDVPPRIAPARRGARGHLSARGLRRRHRRARRRRDPGAVRHPRPLQTTDGWSAPSKRSRTSHHEPVLSGVRCRDRPRTAPPRGEP